MEYQLFPYFTLIELSKVTGAFKWLTELSDSIKLYAFYFHTSMMMKSAIKHKD